MVHGWEGSPQILKSQRICNLTQRWPRDPASLLAPASRGCALPACSLTSEGTPKHNQEEQSPLCSELYPDPKQSSVGGHRGC